jgi:hypothetical protein
MVEGVLEGVLGGGVGTWRGEGSAWRVIARIGRGRLLVSVCHRCIKP